MKWKVWKRIESIPSIQSGIKILAAILGKFRRQTLRYLPLVEDKIEQEASWRNCSLTCTPADRSARRIALVRVEALISNEDKEPAIRRLFLRDENREFNANVFAHKTYPFFYASRTYRAEVIFHGRLIIISDQLRRFIASPCRDKEIERSRSELNRNGTERGS